MSVNSKLIRNKNLKLKISGQTPFKGNLTRKVSI
jgi:hypothetical protein